MAAVGKHFPGHGAVQADSHVEVPEDQRALETILATDAVPFRELADRVDAIMPAHVVVFQCRCRPPAGFSPFWLRDILARELGFRGVGGQRRPDHGRGIRRRRTPRTRGRGTSRRL